MSISNSTALPTQRKISDGNTSCVFEHGTLRVIGGLHLNQTSSFRHALASLLHGSDANVVFDLSACDYLSSLFIGEIVAAVLQLKEANRNFRIYVSPELGKFFETAQLHHLFAYAIKNTRSHRD